MAVTNQKWLADAAVRVLCVFSLDRFADFVSDQVEISNLPSSSAYNCYIVGHTCICSDNFILEHVHVFCRIFQGNLQLWDFIMVYCDGCRWWPQLELPVRRCWVWSLTS